MLTCSLPMPTLGQILPSSEFSTVKAGSTRMWKLLTFMTYSMSLLSATLMGRFMYQIGTRVVFIYFKTVVAMLACLAAKRLVLVWKSHFCFQGALLVIHMDRYTLLIVVIIASGCYNPMGALQTDLEPKVMVQEISTTHMVLQLPQMEE